MLALHTIRRLLYLLRSSLQGLVHALRGELEELRAQFASTIEHARAEGGEAAAQEIGEPALLHCIILGSLGCLHHSFPSLIFGHRRLLRDSCRWPCGFS
jgi:hypothetical protein